MGRITKVVTVPKGSGWVMITDKDAYVQNVTKKSVPFAFGDIEPVLRESDCHRLYKIDDNFLNDEGDKMWVKQDANDSYKISVSEVL